MSNMPKFSLSDLVRLANLAANRAETYFRLVRLHQPIGIWLLLWPTLWAIWIASEGEPSSAVFAVFVLGTIVLRSAGCVINDFADRRIDPHVRRTANRPIASGEVAPAEAIVIFVVLMLIAFGLVLTMNTLTVQLAILGAVLTVVYPYMKRLILAPQLVLGLAFAWGVPMAYAAETGAVSRTGWLLYLCTMIWVVIYDTEYAMSDREDDLKLGVKSTAILFGEMDILILAGLHSLLFVGLFLLGRSVELGAWFMVGLAAAAGFALRQLYLIRRRDPDECLLAFRNNAWFGGAVFLGIALDYVLRFD